MPFRDWTALSLTTVSSTPASCSRMGTMGRALYPGTRPQKTSCPSCSAKIKRISSSSSVPVGTAAALDISAESSPLPLT